MVSTNPDPWEQQKSSRKREWRKCLTVTVSLEKALREERCCSQPSIQEDSLLTPLWAGSCSLPELRDEWKLLQPS